MFFGKENILNHATDDICEYCEIVFNMEDIDKNLNKDEYEFDENVLNKKLAYATGLIFCSPFWNKEVLCNGRTWSDTWEERWLFMNLPKEKTAENIDIINSVLHQLHTENPELRNEFKIIYIDVPVESE